jgi:hypothetical protein
MIDRVLRWLALPFLRRLRDEAFLTDYQCELLHLDVDQ